MSDPHVLTARHYATGEWVHMSIDGPRIVSVESTESRAGKEGSHESRFVEKSTQPRESASELDPWIAPAFWDLQVNGRWGVSFSDATITPEQVARIANAQATMGTARFCPTLITASRESMLAGSSAIAAACDADPLLNHQVLGIHLEGPWISPIDGYRGAHPRDHVRDPDWNEFQELQRASGSRIVLVTLAPERPGALEMIRRLHKVGVATAIGHSAANSETIAQAMDAGLRMATHLGNGIPAILPRHPNVLWSLAGKGALWSSFIADGHHVDFDTLRVLMQAKSRRSLLVSDASPLAGSEPGLYGPWEVRDDGRIVVAGTPYLAGSSVTLSQAINNMIKHMPMLPHRAIEAATIRPAQALSKSPPRIAAGQPSDLILFRWNHGDGVIEADRTLQLLSTCLLGSWMMPDTGAESLNFGD